MYNPHEQSPFRTCFSSVQLHRIPLPPLPRRAAGWGVEHRIPLPLPPGEPQVGSRTPHSPPSPPPPPRGEPQVWGPTLPPPPPRKTAGWGSYTAFSPPTTPPPRGEPQAGGSNTTSPPPRAAGWESNTACSPPPHPTPRESRIPPPLLPRESRELGGEHRIPPPPPPPLSCLPQLYLSGSLFGVRFFAYVTVVLFWSCCFFIQP